MRNDMRDSVTGGKRVGDVNDVIAWRWETHERCVVVFIGDIDRHVDVTVEIVISGVRRAHNETIFGDIFAVKPPRGGDQSGDGVDGEIAASLGERRRRRPAVGDVIVRKRVDVVRAHRSDLGAGRLVLVDAELVAWLLKRRRVVVRVVNDKYQYRAGGQCRCAAIGGNQSKPVTVVIATM